MQTIYLITTDGTIEKEYSEQLGVVLNNTSKVGDYLKRLRLPDCQVRVIPLINKDSLEMTPEDRANLLVKVKELLSLKCPIIISHGTDTMVEGGALIEKSLPGLQVPVILTGAWGLIRVMAYRTSPRAFWRRVCSSRGVYVVFHSQVILSARAQEDKVRGTFVAIGVPQ